LALLGYMSRLDTDEAKSLYSKADNMTESLGALGCLLNNGQGQAEAAAFYERWKDQRLVIDKWFALQIGCASPADCVEITRALTKHKDFDWKNPNRFRSVIGSLGGNQAGFHRQDGAGYTLYADWMLILDPVNAQITARMCGAFETWRRFDAGRQALIKAQLDRILAVPTLSRNTREMLTRIVNG
jgi:aminopeptidase N